MSEVIFNGALVRRLRLAQGHSLTGFADRIGMSASYLAKLERGERRHPSFASVCRITDGLGIPAAVLARLGDDL